MKVKSPPTILRSADREGVRCCMRRGVADGDVKLDALLLRGRRSVPEEVGERTWFGTESPSRGLVDPH